VPADTPVTSPDAFTDATAVLPDVQLPPPIPLFNVVDWPTHIVIVPLIDVGRTFTVTCAVRRHVVGRVYVIVALPFEIPITIPEELTVAMPVALLLHVPPIGLLITLVELPSHTSCVPVITAGSAFTFTVAVRIQPAAV
jgi:hypothetical protein